MHTPTSKAVLETAISSLLLHASATITPTAGDGGNASVESSPAAAPVSCLYQLYYEQKSNRSSTKEAVEGQDPKFFDFPAPSVSLTFDDSTLEPVQQAWEKIMGSGEPAEKQDDDVHFMVFADREGVGDDDDFE